MAVPPFFFDTHVHLDLLPPQWNLTEELTQARLAGVGAFLVPGVRSREWPHLSRLAQENSNVFIAPGLHPLAAAEWTPQARRALEELLCSKGVAALGEIGLDALIEVPVEVQEAAFRGQLRLAVEAGVPILLHCRKAAERLFRIVREEGGKRVGGILHAFSGSPESALLGVDLGFVVAFGGTLTYPQARRAPQVLRALPPESIVLETDAPDLPPHPYRGETNRPAWLSLVANKVAEIREWSLEETARITTRNARRILKTPLVLPGEEREPHQEEV